IFISEDFATPNNTPASGAPAGAEPKASPTNSLPGWQEQGFGRDPTRPSSAGGGVDIGPPVRVNDPPAAGQPRAEVRPEDIVVEPQGLARGNPVINIPSPGGNGARREAVAPSGGRMANPPYQVAAQVPSCVLTGRQLNNFALYDVNGQP